MDKNNWLNLNNKVAVVTGGASGIGKAIAKTLEFNGMNVVISDINIPENIRDEFESDRVLFIETDVTKKEDVERLINNTIDKLGTIDVFVNNAGINLPKLLVDTRKEKEGFELDEVAFDAMYNVNQKGVFLCAQAAARVMALKGKGVIINISSESGLEGSEGQSAYAATKGAVNSLTRSWAKELGQHGIRVVGVAPGIIETTGLRTIEYEEALAYTRNTSVEALRKGYESSSVTPLGRVGKLSEIADVVAFLGSERSSYIHGVTLNIAGGKTRG